MHNDKAEQKDKEAAFDAVFKAHPKLKDALKAAKIAEYLALESGTEGTVQEKIAESIRTFDANMEKREVGLLEFAARILEQKAHFLESLPQE